jgi:hypothetical protein
MHFKEFTDQNWKYHLHFLRNSVLHYIKFNLIIKIGSINSYCRGSKSPETMGLSAVFLLLSGITISMEEMQLLSNHMNIKVP